MLRQQSTAGADDWQLFSNLVPSGDGSTKRLGSHLGEHPADSTGQRWLIGQTALSRSDSAKGTLPHQNSHLSMPFRIDHQISGRGWSRPAYAREQSTRQLQEPSDVHEWMRDMKRRQHKMQVRRPHAPVAHYCSSAAVPSHSLSPELRSLHCTSHHTRLRRSPRCARPAPTDTPPCNARLATRPLTQQEPPSRPTTTSALNRSSSPLFSGPSALGPPIRAGAAAPPAQDGGPRLGLLPRRARWFKERSGSRLAHALRSAGSAAETCLWRPPQLSPPEAAPELRSLSACTH